MGRLSISARTTLDRLIAITANAIEGDREHYLASGLEDYVRKPIRSKELQRALKETQPLETSSLTGQLNQEQT
jgi:CheY-like chemotaxis protein